jgi:hypothetical protein
MTDNRSRLALALASKAVRGSKLRRAKGVTIDVPIANLAKVLMRTSPRSDHGQLLMRAMVPDERLSGPRSPEEEAVRRLLSRGQSPTIRAVASYVADARRVAEAKARREALGARIAGEYGPAVAKAVADRIAETGESYTWAELYRAMGWPWGYPKVIIIRQLERDGWLVTGSEERSLRPGERYSPVASGSP